MARLTRAESRARTRAKLIESAKLVFGEKGYTAATIEEIAEGADFTRGAFYANFADKGDLFMTLIEQTYAEGVEAVSDEPDDAGSLASLPGLRLNPERARGETTFELALLEFWPQALRDPALGERIANQQTALRDTMVAAVKARCERDGVELPVSAEQFASIALALRQGVEVQRFVDRSSISLEGYELALQWLLAGALAQGVPAR
ncbi:MAG: TetR family transcriptional regulator [Acidimicrobiia bacterium]|nr:TetR family transcriptional regulator [Acidimicrobiia bacterium]